MLDKKTSLSLSSPISLLSSSHEGWRVPTVSSHLSKPSGGSGTLFGRSCPSSGGGGGRDGESDGDNVSRGDYGGGYRVYGVCGMGGHRAAELMQLPPNHVPHRHGGGGQGGGYGGAFLHPLQAIPLLYHRRERESSTPTLRRRVRKREGRQPHRMLIVVTTTQSGKLERWRSGDGRPWPLFVFPTAVKTMRRCSSIAHLSHGDEDNERSADGSRAAGQWRGEQWCRRG